MTNETIHLHADNAGEIQTWQADLTMLRDWHAQLLEYETGIANGSQ
jgi:hypothetical protein